MITARISCKYRILCGESVRRLATHTHLASDKSNLSRNWTKDVWYMQLTIDMSVMRKYSTLPLVATGRNSSLAAFIFISVSAATCSLIFTSAAVSLDTFSTVITLSSSTRDPYLTKRITFDVRLSDFSLVGGPRRVPQRSTVCEADSPPILSFFLYWPSLPE